MDAPPVNKLLQLLRQKPPEPPDLSPVAQSAPSRAKRRSTPIPKSSIQPATENGTQTATNGSQYATGGEVEVPSDGIQHATQGGTQHTTGNDITLAIPGLSKGQQRVLQFLVANRDPSDPSRTVLVGYHAISTCCFLSRNGSRKVIEELCKKCLIKRIATQRGGMQGSIYALESGIQSATDGSTPFPTIGSEESSPQCAINTPFCSSSKKLLLHDLLLEDAFRDLNARSLEPYLEQFEATEDIQNFLDIANACITAAKAGRGKP